MVSKTRPYEQFGPFILFKKLESDALTELWRAAHFDASGLGSLVALRRFVNGERQALQASAEYAATMAPQLSGSSFVRKQEIGVINGIPYLAHEYAGGRSLRHIIDRARGGAGTTPNPVPLDQAIVIAEKVALSLATTADLRQHGQRLSHGALLPHFIWISDDGEIRVAGQGLGSGIINSLGDSRIAAELGHYFAPEYQINGETSKTTDVYSMGAILYLLASGAEPPDPTTASAFSQTIRASKTMGGAPMPEDIRLILDKSMQLDPSRRYPTIGEMKQELSALVHGGKYSATTFNLAFYLSNLLKKEMEGETIDRDREGKVNVAPYLEAAPPPVAIEEPRVAAVPAMFTTAEEPKKSRAPLMIAAVLLLAGIGFGAWYLLRPKARPTPPATVATATVAPAPAPAVVAEPVLAATSTQTATSGGATDSAAQQKAFEEAVRLKMQEEMMKLQTEYTRTLQREHSKNAPVPVTPSPTIAAAQTTEERSPSAAELDQQRRDTALQQAAAQPSTPVPQPATSQPASPAPAPASAPAQQTATVREGDVVDVLSLDSPPRATSQVKPIYPPMARTRRLEGTVIVTALISETGDVIDVKILKGMGMGLDEAALRAMRNWKFSPPMKDGKRVRTWRPQPFVFTL